MGIDMYNQLGDAAGIILDPQAENMAFTLFCLSSIVICIITLFPIFVALNADGVVAWSWGVVFIPVWLVDLAALAFIVGRYFLSGVEVNEEWLHQETEGEDGEQVSREERERRKQDKLRQIKFFEFVKGTKRLVQFLVFLLFQIFIVLKLDNTVEWSWAAVFTPWFILEGFHFFSNAVLAFYVISTTSADMSDENVFNSSTYSMNSLSEMLKPTWKKALILLSVYRYWIYRVVLAILIVYRADEKINVGWGVVFIPVYAQFADLMIMPVVNFRRISPSVPAEHRQSMYGFLVTRLLATMFFGVLFFISLGLFMARLNADIPTDSYSVGVIFIPVFILFSLAFCCCCCCLPCTFVIAGAGLEAAHGEQQQQVSPMHRIEYLINAPKQNKNEIGSSTELNQRSSKSSGAGSSRPSQLAPRSPRPSSSS